MGLSYVASASITNAAGSTIQNQSCAVPTGTANGDTMIAIAYGPDTGTATLTAPTGWTSASTTVNDATNSLSATLFTRVAASEPSSYTWKASSSVIWGVGIVTIRSASTSSPFDASATNSTTSSSPSVTPTITTTQADWLYTAHVSRASTTTSVTSTCSAAGTKILDIGENGGASTRNCAVWLSEADKSIGSNGGLSVTLNEAVVGGINFTFGISEGILVVSGAADTGHGTDAASGIRNKIGDTAVGADTAVVVAVVPGAADTGAGSDTGSSVVPVNGADTGAGADSAVVKAVVTGAADTGSGIETFNVTSAGATLAFGSDTGTEHSSATTALGGVQTDSGTFTESAVLAIQGYLPPGQRIVRVQP